MITITNAQIAGFAVIFTVVLVITFLVGYCFGNDRKRGANEYFEKKSH